jgi:hypothetical protein
LRSFIALTLVMLLASLVVKVPANVMLTVNLLNGRRPGRELAREQECRVENSGRRKERVVDSVNVAVLGFDVGQGYLGIEVDLESWDWERGFVHERGQEDEGTAAWLWRGNSLGGTNFFSTRILNGRPSFAPNLGRRAVLRGGGFPYHMAVQ